MTDWTDWRPEDRCSAQSEALVACLALTPRHVRARCLCLSTCMVIKSHLLFVFPGLFMLVILLILITQFK